MNRRLAVSCAVLLLSAFSVATGWAQSEPDMSDTLVLRGATLIDGNGGEPLEDAVVVVSNGRIIAVGPADEVEVPIGARVEGVTGHFLMPGLIDHHAHVVVPAYEATAEGRRFAGFDWTLSKRLVRALLRFGVTTARSPSTPTKLGVAMRDSIAAGDILGPRLFVSGEYINDATLSPQEVRAKVEAQVGVGVDYIKLYQRLGPDAVRAGIKEAHAHGVPVIGHLRRTSWSEGIAAGIDFLTHGAPWTTEMLSTDDGVRYEEARRGRGGMRARIDWLELLDPYGPEAGTVIAAIVEAGIPIDPTLVAYDTKFSFDADNMRPVAPVYRKNDNLHAADGLPEMWAISGSNTDDWTTDDFNRMAAVWPKLLALVKRYHDENVLLTAGSDTPNPWVIPGESLHRELELLVASGISPGDVLRIATRNGADALGLLEETGTIETGKRADLLLLTANPLSNISNTRHIAWVMLEGKRYPPSKVR